MVEARDYFLGRIFAAWLRIILGKKSDILFSCVNLRKKPQKRKFFPNFLNHKIFEKQKNKKNIG